MKSRWLALFALLLGTYAAIPASAATDSVERHCIGLLWCTEKSANSASTEGLLWLYSSEERGSYSRLAVRPLYSMEEDPTQDLLRRSILWPLRTDQRERPIATSCRSTAPRTTIPNDTIFFSRFMATSTRPRPRSRDSACSACRQPRDFLRCLLWLSSNM